MESEIDMDQDRYARNWNRLKPYYKKDDLVITLYKSINDESKFDSNDDVQTDDGDMINKTNYSSLHQLFIGNLTWWTTDQDIMDAITNVGVHNIIDIQFFENRENGQSKGFCVVTLESEQNLNQILKKLPNEFIHGRNPIVTFPSSSAYFMFESKSETRLSLPSAYQNISFMTDMSRIPSQKSLKNPSVGKPYHIKMPPMSGYKKTHKQYPKITGYENQRNISYQQNTDKSLVTSEKYQEEVGSSLSQTNQSYHCQVPVNPMIFNQISTPLTYSQSYLYKDYHPSCTHSYEFRTTNEIKMTEAEINYIINRNRIVSSSAIARAITNATNGEYFSAIETLNTAIALIEDSKMANDERSKILVCTLYNIIHGIQAKVVKKKKKFSRPPSDRLFKKSKREHSLSDEYI